jgi:hypothetical protein
MLSTTFDAERAAPDGSHRFTEGTVVEVQDDDVAKRWIRNKLAEEFDGPVGTTVSNEDRALNVDQIDAEIQKLKALRDRAQAQVQVQAATNADAITRASLPEGRRGQDDGALEDGDEFADDLPDAEEGGLAGRTPQPLNAPREADTPYRAADESHPLARYKLTEAQRVALERAGFTRPEQIADAEDAELLEVQGIGEGVLRRLRAT